MKSFFRKLRWLTQRPGKEAELREELEFHLAEEVSEREAEGLPKEEARWAARRELGSLTLVEENTRAVWGWTFLEQLVQDLRFAVRTMGTPPQSRDAWDGWEHVGRRQEGREQRRFPIWRLRAPPAEQVGLLQPVRLLPVGETQPDDPRTGRATLLAGYMPARKASRIDPVTAIRHE